MIEKNWRFSQDKDGHFCMYYKNPVTGEWDLYQKIKKPKYKNGSMVKRKKRCILLCNSIFHYNLFWEINSVYIYIVFYNIY